MKHFDLFVLGTGVAGTAIAKACADAGLTTAISDIREYGGTCAQRGCVPKKVLWGAAQIVRAAELMKGKGIDGAPSISWKDLMAFKNTFTEPVAAQKEKAFTEKGIATFHGKAQFIAANQLKIGDETIEADKIVIATGAHPRELTIPGAEFTIDSEGFLELDTLPRSILFIGGGFVAMEFAHIAASCGAKITVLQQGEQILENFDIDIVNHLRQTSEAREIKIATSTQVTRVSKTRAGYTVSGQHKGQEVNYETELVVNAAGRVPYVDNLNLDQGGVAYSKKGISVNDYLQSVSNEYVYSAGDVSDSGGLPLTPFASKEAEIVTANILKGNHRKHNFKEMPSVVFTLPPLSAVGLTEKQAKEKGLNFRVNFKDASESFHAKSINEPQFAFKIIIDNKTEKILGAHLIGPHAEETINLFAMAIYAGLTADDIKKIIFVYPSEGDNIPDMM